MGHLRRNPTMSLLPAGALALVVLAQAPAGAIEYHVGPGDVLEVAVANRPDLSRLPTVQTTGEIWLPRAGDVAVAGLTCAEAERRIAPLLAAEDLRTPQVSVRVREYLSQFVWVRGAVARPGRKPLRAGTRLIDALLDAGGFTAVASGKVTLQRAQGTLPGGGTTIDLRFSGGQPTSRELEELSLGLMGGDVIMVDAQYWVTISGAVAKPGRYDLDGEMTITRLIQEAGGLTRSAQDRLTVQRRDAKTGAAQTLEVDLGAIRAGSASDLALQPDDQVSVRTRRF
jgi:polysaccharide export outer membrane protein